MVSRSMKSLEKKILRHLKIRGWDKLRPSDLAKSVMVEGAELLELLQWENLSLEDVKRNKEKLRAIEGELADVFIYVFEMSVLLDLDTEKIIRDKLEFINKKYPAKLMLKVKQEPGTEEEYWRIKKEYRIKGK